MATKTTAADRVQAVAETILEAFRTGVSLITVSGGSRALADRIRRGSGVGVPRRS